MSTPKASNEQSNIIEFPKLTKADLKSILKRSRFHQQKTTETSGKNLEDNAKSPPEFLLKELLKIADTLSNILVMVEGKSGEIGFTGTLNGFEASMVFIDRIKLKAMQADSRLHKYNKGDGDSNGPA